MDVATSNAEMCNVRSLYSLLNSNENFSAPMLQVLSPSTADAIFNWPAWRAFTSVSRSSSFSSAVVIRFVRVDATIFFPHCRGLGGGGGGLEFEFRDLGGGFWGSGGSVGVKTNSSCKQGLHVWDLQDFQAI